jgi:formate hydrogenlyase subunit 6/NADH:ubiquinone oxidoreductase subunit I
MRSPDRSRRPVPEQTIPEPSAPPMGVPLLDAARCTGERRCEEVCPSAAISLAPVVRGRLLWRIDYGACVLCGRCQEACPAEAIAMHEMLEPAVERREDLIFEAEVVEARPRRPPAPGEWYGR